MRFPLQYTVTRTLFCSAFVMQIQAQTLELSELNGTNGFQIQGQDQFDRFGYSVSGIGDINGDGIGDFVLGAPSATPTQYAPDNGIAYVVFGSEQPFTGFFDVSTLDGTNGFQVVGNESIDRLGIAVSGAGDVNGDGFSDLLLGAYGVDYNGYNGERAAGAAYVLFGRAEPFPAIIRPSSLDGSNGFAIQGTTIYDTIGAVVSSAGDINGDGFADILLSSYRVDANGFQNAGQAQVVFGQADGFPAVISISDLDGSNGFVINGIEAQDEAGATSSGAGDVNGDGFDDIIIGAPRSSGGQVFLIFGSGAPFAAEFELSNIDGTNGIVIGVSANNAYGPRTASGAGDMNGDGFSDIIVGAYQNDAAQITRAGVTFVIFGGAALSSPLFVDQLDGTNGFSAAGLEENNRFGRSVSSVGDVNGDGFFDAISAAPGATSGTGNAYVIYGRGVGHPDFPFPAEIDITQTLPTQLRRVKGIEAGDYAGYATSSAGDINGDGFADYLVGARNADAGDETRAGEAYVIFGSSNAATQESASYKAFAIPGDAPRKAIGTTGDGADDSTPASRVWIDFAGGAAANAQASLQTVTLTRNNAAIQNISNTAGFHLQITTDRVDSAAEITVRYLNSDVDGLVEEELRLYTAPTPQGPWVNITSPTNPFGGQNPDVAQNRINGSAASLNGYYVISTDVPPPPSVDLDAWLLY